MALVSLGGRQYDYALDCTDCGRMWVYATQPERDEELAKHDGHDTEIFLQGRI